MKIQSTLGSMSFEKTHKYTFNANNTKANSQNINFKGTLPTTKPPFLDRLMNAKAVKGLFKLASQHPFPFNVIAMATACILLRPPTIMLMPGSNKEDKSYAAAKSIIGSVIANGSRLILIFPLGIAMAKMGEKALKDHTLKFPKIKTKEYEAYNYLISNSAGFILSLGMSGPIIYTLTKVMNKIMPPKKDCKNPKTSDTNDLNKKAANTVGKGGKNGN